jgi:hypothetical protein
MGYFALMGLAKQANRWNLRICFKLLVIPGKAPKYLDATGSREAV